MTVPPTQPEPESGPPGPPPPTSRLPGCQSAFVGALLAFVLMFVAALNVPQFSTFVAVFVGGVLLVVALVATLMVRRPRLRPYAVGFLYGFGGTAIVLGGPCIALLSGFPTA